MALYSFDIGGSERLGLQLSKLYLNHGFRVVCCATRRGRGPLMEQFQKLHIPCLALDLESNNRLNRAVIKHQLSHWLIEHAVSCVHAQHFCVLSDVHRPSKRARVQTQIVTEHTPELYDRSSKRITRKLAKQVSRVIAINSVVQDAIEQVGRIPKSDIVVIGNGIDTATFCPQTKPQRGHCQIIWLGRLHPHKDILTGLKAFREAQKKHCNLRINIVGDGEERLIAESFIRDNNLTDSVTLSGELADPGAALQEADVFLMSSITEGTPLAMLEALSCGMPVVSTAVGGIPGVISPAVGILAPPRDPVALANGIVRLANDERLRAQMGVRARQLAVDLYSDERMGKEYINLIELLNG